jgi:hypothetical protein
VLPLSEGYDRVPFRMCLASWALVVQASIIAPVVFKRKYRDFFLGIIAEKDAEVNRAVSASEILLQGS